MANQRNTDIVSSLSSDLTTYDTIILVDYVGVTHQQLEEIRNTIKSHGGTIRVVKNSLLKRALEASGVDVSGQAFEGSTAVLMTNAADLSPIKIIHDKGTELENLSIKWGVWEHATISKEYAVRLATLPSKDELIAQLLGQLKSPQTKLVYALKGNLQKLVIALEGIRSKKHVLIPNS